MQIFITLQKLRNLNQHNNPQLLETQGLLLLKTLNPRSTTILGVLEPVESKTLIKSGLPQKMKLYQQATPLRATANNVIM